MVDKKLSDYTEKEFSDFITKIKKVDFPSEAAHDEAIYEFAMITEHPEGWNLIYHPQQGADTSNEAIIDAIKEWCKANGKPGFKPA